MSRTRRVGGFVCVPEGQLVLRHGSALPSAACVRVQGGDATAPRGSRELKGGKDHEDDAPQATAPGYRASQDVSTFAAAATVGQRAWGPPRRRRSRIGVPRYQEVTAPFGEERGQMGAYSRTSVALAEQSAKLAIPSFREGAALRGWQADVPGVVGGKRLRGGGPALRDRLALVEGRLLTVRKQGQVELRVEAARFERRRDPPRPPGQPFGAWGQPLLREELGERDLAIEQPSARPRARGAMAGDRSTPASRRVTDRAISGVPIVAVDLPPVNSRHCRKPESRDVQEEHPGVPADDDRRRSGRGSLSTAPYTRLPAPRRVGVVYAILGRLIAYLSVSAACQFSSATSRDPPDAGQMRARSWRMERRARRLPLTDDCASARRSSCHLRPRLPARPRHPARAPCCPATSSTGVDRGSPRRGQGTFVLDTGRDHLQCTARAFHRRARSTTPSTIPRHLLHHVGDRRCA